MKMLIQNLTDWTQGYRVLSGFEAEDIPPFHCRLFVDSRSLEPGGIFVCIKGEKTDGHHFIEHAIERGAQGIITERIVKIDRPGVFQIHVDSSQEALKRLAGKIMLQLHPKVIGITGSAGKTTVKEMLQAVFSTCYSCFTTVKNYNTPIGVPLSIARMPCNTQYLMAELSASYPGEITETLSFLSLDHGILTGIGSSHLKFFGSEKDVFEEKIKLANSIKDHGKLWMNGDQCWFEKAAQRISLIHSFGMKSHNDIQATDITKTSNGLRFDVIYHGDKLGSFQLNAWGRHMIMDALPVIALALEEGVSAHLIKKSLAEFFPGKGRGRCIRLRENLTVLDESYNANPYSMQAALEALLNIPFSRKIIVLGDMLELGEQAEDLHRSLGTLIMSYSQPLDTVIYVGEYGAIVREASRIPEERFSCVGHWKDALSVVMGQQLNDTALLIKASNGMMLHCLADELERLLK